MSRLKIDECALQRVDAKNVGKEPEKNEKPITWRAQPAGVADPYIREVQREQQRGQSGIRWGAVNKPIQW